MESLLGLDELEKQQIYFAAPEQLNDPVEGYKDVFWLGDPVLWANLLRHYVLCLFWSALGTLQSSTDGWAPPDVPVRLSVDQLPTNALRVLYKEATDASFSDPSFRAALEHLAKLKIPLRRSGVLFFLTHVHPAALRSVLAAFATRGLIRKDAAASILDGGGHAKVFQALENLVSQTPLDERAFDQLLTVFDTVSRQQRLRMTYAHRGDPEWRKRAYLFLEFPPSYVSALAGSLMHPPWYVASFAESCENASAWAAYAGNHTGVALKFRIRESSPGVSGITLRCVNGASFAAGRHSFTSGAVTFAFEPIRYTDRPPEIDFFRFLGQLTWPQLQRDWLTDSGGNKSERLRDALLNTDAWRKELWELFRASATTKMRDWSHEMEYRIVRVDLLGAIATNRYATYDFADLAGIVFGINSTPEEQCRILEIVERKCRETHRSDFEFSQVRYSRFSGALEVVPLTLL